MSHPLPIVDCQDCGVCCRHMGYPAFNLPLEELRGEDPLPFASASPAAERDRARWLAMPGSLRASLREVIRAYEPPVNGELDGPCVWLDPNSMLCRHHQHRPQVCRDFEIGSASCLDWRRAYGKPTGSS